MKKALLWVGGALALAFLALTVVNASWLAPHPAGAPKQVAQRALAPQLARSVSAQGDADCRSDRIEQPYHRYLPNTRSSILRAQKMGAWLVEVDARLTTDGEVVLFEPERLDCITDGSGPVGEAGLDTMRSLDPGYGVTVADGTTPFRGEGARIITLDEALSALPLRGRLMVHLAGSDPALPDAVAAVFDRLDRDPTAKGDAFFGSGEQVARLREALPDVWAFSPARARQCTNSYVRYGWTGYVPQQCRGETMLIALDQQTLLWGWPDRLIARMREHDVTIVIEGPRSSGPNPGTDAVDGITLPEQLTQIPASFNGYVFTDDAFTTLPALITRFDDRSQAEIDASDAALARRRRAKD